MTDKSKIEWTDATWNPIRGCSRVSEGCRNCYAERIAARFTGPGQPYEGLARIHRTPACPPDHERSEGRWTGKVRFIPELLEQPLHWRRPRKIFVNSMSDLFHEKIDTEWINQIVAAMLVCPQHTFQILTKRPERMKAYFCGVSRADIEPHMARIRPGYGRLDWPWRNIWLGVSVEDQKTADERIPLLLQTPAAVRWVSYEPALGPVNFSKWDGDCRHCPACGFCFFEGHDKTCPDPDLGFVSKLTDPSLDWIVAGGESGPGARPAHPDWFRAVRDQCQAAGVPFFFKQWGEWEPVRSPMGILMERVGKKRAGRLLDGREWNEFPAGKDSQCS